MAGWPSWTSGCRAVLRFSGWCPQIHANRCRLGDGQNPNRKTKCDWKPIKSPRSHSVWHLGALQNHKLPWSIYPVTAVSSDEVQPKYWKGNIYCHCHPLPFKSWRCGTLRRVAASVQLERWLGQPVALWPWKTWLKFRLQRSRSALLGK